MSNLRERRLALAQIDLYPVIGAEFCRGRSVLAMIQAVAAGGARIVQLREKQLAKRAYLELALAARVICDQHGLLLIINDQVDLALAAGADGVHLGQDDLPLPVARQLGPELLLGASAHSLAEALEAQAAGADYVNLGPLFATQTKALTCPPLGLGILDEVPPRLQIPFTVMGGIKRRHLPELVARGATKIAMVTEITEADEVAARVSELRQVMAGQGSPRA